MKKTQSLLALCLVALPTSSYAEEFCESISKLRMSDAQISQFASLCLPADASASVKSLVKSSDGGIQAVVAYSALQVKVADKTFWIYGRAPSIKNPLFLELNEIDHEVALLLSDKNRVSTFKLEVGGDVVAHRTFEMGEDAQAVSLSIHSDDKNDNRDLLLVTSTEKNSVTVFSRTANESDSAAKNSTVAKNILLGKTLNFDVPVHAVLAEKGSSIYVLDANGERVVVLTLAEDGSGYEKAREIVRDSSMSGVAKRIRISVDGKSLEIFDGKMNRLKTLTEFQ